MDAVREIIKKHFVPFSKKTPNKKEIEELKKACSALDTVLNSTVECKKCKNLVDKSNLIQITIDDVPQEMCKLCAIAALKEDPKKKKAKKITGSSSASGKSRTSSSTAGKSGSNSSSSSKPPATKTDPPPGPGKNDKTEKKRDNAFDKLKKEIKKVLEKIAVPMSPEATVQFLRSELKDKIKGWNDDTILMALNQLKKDKKGKPDKTDNQNPEGWD